MDNDIGNIFPIHTGMFVFEGPHGKLTWEPIPEIVAELKKLAEASAGRPPDPEQLEAAALAFVYVFRDSALSYMELLALSMFGTGNGKTDLWAMELILALKNLLEETQRRGLQSPEMAEALTKRAINKELQHK